MFIVTQLHCYTGLIQLLYQTVKSIQKFVPFISEINSYKQAKLQMFRFHKVVSVDEFQLDIG